MSRLYAFPKKDTSSARSCPNPSPSLHHHPTWNDLWMTYQCMLLAAWFSPSSTYTWRTWQNLNFTMCCHCPKLASMILQIIHLQKHPIWSNLYQFVACRKGRLLKNSKGHKETQVTRNGCGASPCSYLKFQGLHSRSQLPQVISSPTLQPKVGLIKPASMLMYGSNLIAVTWTQIQSVPRSWLQISKFWTRKPCPRRRAPIEEVATPWALSFWTWRIVTTWTPLMAFPRELHTPPETTMYFTPWGSERQQSEKIVNSLNSEMKKKRPSALQDGMLHLLEMVAARAWMTLHQTHPQF